MSSEQYDGWHLDIEIKVKREKRCDQIILALVLLLAALPYHTSPRLPDVPLLVENETKTKRSADRHYAPIYMQPSLLLAALVLVNFSLHGDLTLCLGHVRNEHTQHFIPGIFVFVAELDL